MAVRALSWAIAVIAGAVALITPALAQSGLNGGISGPGSAGASLNGVLSGAQSINGLPGGPLGSNGLALPSGSLNVWVPQTYGWGGSAAGACIIVGESYPNPISTQTGNCPIIGTVGGSEPPSAYARYTLRDSVGLVVYEHSTPQYIGTKTGTFTSTTFVPATPYSATQVAKFRYQMPVDTNDTPAKYAGVLTSWAADGTSITVSGWYLWGCTAPCSPGTPTGTTALVGDVSKIYATNFICERVTGASPTASVCGEIDVDNSTGVDDAGVDQLTTPYDGGLVIGGGPNIVSFGLLTVGKMNAQIVVEGAGIYGVKVSPTAGNALTYAYQAFGVGVSIGYLSQTAPTGEALRVADTSGPVVARILSTGNAEWGREASPASTPTQAFWSSGNGAGMPDATWTYTGGTGNNDGAVNVSVGSFSINSNVGVTCPTGSPSSSFATVKGIVTHC